VNAYRPLRPGGIVTDASSVGLGGAIDPAALVQPGAQF